EPCEEILQSDLLKNSFINALDEAEAYYRIHVFTKAVGDQKKTLVLMAPLKAPFQNSDEKSANVKPPTRLFDYFNHIGLQEQDSNQSWGERLSAKALQSVHYQASASA